MAAFVIGSIAAFALTAGLTPLVIAIAKRCHCYDIPGKRRFHRVKTPRWGGIAFFLGLAPVLFVLGGGDRRMISFLAGALVLVVTGVVDDRRSLGWKGKMSAIAAATSIVVFGGGLAVHRLADLGTAGMLELGALSIPFTYFGVIGVTNAMNMIDGLNGLSAGISLLAFLFFGIAAAIVGNAMLAGMSFAFCGAMAGFLLYNFPRARIFMGDSGSMFLGFSLAVGAILLTQDPRHPVDPFFPFFVLVLPIFDAVRIMTVRISKGRSPFKADKGHLHHLIHRNKTSTVQTVVLLWTMTGLAGIGALLLLRNASGPFIAAASAAMIGIGMLAQALTKRPAVRSAGGGARPHPAGRRSLVPKAHDSALVPGPRARYENISNSDPDVIEAQRR
jgi:UDP-GlcNAc:undecaprenyl-phosphate GlcNAc-1-phosphate transferase